MTAWMLIGNWRHTRRRMQAQQALVAETNFRRAMENSMLTGMRALDLQGRITYVNAAFCQMTGWSEAELVGRTPPFPYWPEADREQLAARLDDELHGRTLPGGFQVRVKRKDGSLFDARLYVSPLIDAKRPPDRLDDLDDRHHRAESHPRAAVGLVRALHHRAGGAGRLGFGGAAGQRGAAVRQQAVPPVVRRADRRATCRWWRRRACRASPRNDESLDEVDSFVGLPTGTLTAAQPENAEIFVPELGKWLEVRSRYLNWVDGRLAQMVIATDITPRRHAEEQSAAQAERAQSASRLITMGEMASSVAHELNQPLTAINNYCNGLVSRIKGQQINDDDLLAALDKTAQAGAARRPDHPAHPLLREAQRAQPHACPT